MIYPHTFATLLLINEHAICFLPAACWFRLVSADYLFAIIEYDMTLPRCHARPLYIAKSVIMPSLCYATPSPRRLPRRLHYRLHFPLIRHNITSPSFFIIHAADDTPCRRLSLSSPIRDAHYADTYRCFNILPMILLSRQRDYAIIDYLHCCHSGCASPFSSLTYAMPCCHSLSSTPSHPNIRSFTYRGSQTAAVTVSIAGRLALLAGSQREKARRVVKE